MRESWFSVLSVYLVFVLAPLLLAGVSLSRGIQLLRSSEIQTLRFDLSQKTRDLFQEASEEVLVRKAFNRPSPGGSVQGFREFLGTFPPKKDSTPDLDLLAGFLSRKIPVPQEDLVALKNQIGWEVDFTHLCDNPLFPFPACWGKDRAWLIWERETTLDALGYQASYSIRVGLYVLPSEYERLKKALSAKRFKRNETGAVLNLRSRQVFRTGPIPFEHLREALRKRKKEARIEVDWGDSLSRLEMLDHDQAIYLEVPFSSWSPEAIRRFVWPGVGALAILLLVLFPSLMRRASSISIRVRMLGMFSLAVILPLSGVYVLSLGILADRRLMKTNEAIQAVREEVMKFDEGFRSEESRSAAYLNTLVRAPELRTGNFARFKKRVARAFRDQQARRVEVRDWKNRIRLRMEMGDPDNGYDLLTEAMSQRGIEEIVGKSEKEKLTAVKLFTSSLMETPEFPFMEIIRKPLALHLMKFGHSLFYAFWMTGPDPKSPFAYIHVNRGHRQAVFNYAGKTLAANRSVKIFVRDRATGRWFPKSAGHPEIQSIIQGVVRSGEDQVGRFSLGEDSYLAVGLTALQLEKFDLVGIIRENAALAEIRSLRWQIGGAMAMALLIGFICAWFLAENLLVPLSDLGLGMEALRRKNAAYRIPLRGTDEMGKLAQAFNHMIETMGELDMAKVVQERLFPNKFPQFPGYQVSLKNQMISTIGGDYCDCFKTRAGKMFFLIGDVTGHGVGAALMMSMAKAVVSLHFEEGGREEDLLPRLNAVLYDLKSGGQFMTFLAGVLDPELNRVSFTFAGHPFPILCNGKTGTVGFVEQKRYPLGVRRKQEFSFVSADFPPGSALLLYTDGVPESVGPTGEPFGYGPIKDIVRQSAPLGAKAILDHFDQALAKHTAGLPFNDDVTLFVITRIPEPEVPA